jgi:secondary thiamine-phosphate synthase enzyme
VSGSTAGLTTIEYEPGLVQDLPAAFERIAPRSARYRHHERWGDDNGHSHVRASLLGPSLVVPVEGGRLLLGTWQQIVLVDFDTRARRRDVVVQLWGQQG